MAYNAPRNYEEWRRQRELDEYFRQQQQAELEAAGQNQQASGIGETAGELGGAYVAEQAPNWFGFGSSAAPVASSAAPAASSTLAATPAANAAWNAGATQAGGGLSGGGSSAAGMSGGAMAGSAAALAAAINAARSYEQIRTKNRALSDKEVEKIWFPLGDPVSKIPVLGDKKYRHLWDPGGLPSKIFGSKKLFGGKYKTEWNRAQKLRDQGINWNWTKEEQKKGLSKDELLRRVKEKGGNLKFTETRDEKYLTPDEIAGYATFGEKFGNDWVDKYGTQGRRDIAQLVLDAGAANERHGSVDVDWNKGDLQKKIDDYLKKLNAPKPSTSKTTGKSTGGSSGSKK